MFSPEPERVSAPQELVAALESGQLVAEGTRFGGTGVRERIPGSEWRNVLISGDHVAWVSGGNTVPARWSDITLERAAVERHWRLPAEVSARTTYDWSALREIHDDLRTVHPEFSQNKLIIEIQGAFRDRFNKEPPSRTTLQRTLRKWS